MKSIVRRVMARKWLIIILVVIAAFIIFVVKPFGGTSVERKEAVVEQGEVKEELVLSGEIHATDYANLQFNTSGKLNWVGVKIGDQVKKGQGLMKLDTVKLNSAYQVALATWRASRANVDQVHDEVKGNDSDETFEEKNTRTAAEAANDKAYEAYVSALKDLTDASLIAPFDGMVASITTESPGVNITGGTPQISLVNPKTIYFLVNADQTEVSRFKVGDKAEVILDAFDGEKIVGTITAVSIAPNNAESGTVYPIRISLNINDSDYKYKIGMTGDARFTLSEKDNVLYIPANFIKSDKEGKYVLVNEGKDKKYIKTGVEGEDRIEITGEISAGEKIYN